MTRLADMTATQRQSWLVLLADGAVFYWFWQKMTVGFSLRLIDYDMAQFGSIIFRLIALTIILHVAISITFEIAAKNSDKTKDERDISIERQGTHWGYRILQFGTGAVVFGILMTGIFGDDYIAPLNFETPVQIIFALVMISYIADLVKHAVIIYRYGH